MAIQFSEPYQVDDHGEAVDVQRGEDWLGCIMQIPHDFGDGVETYASGALLETFPMLANRNFNSFKEAKDVILEQASRIDWIAWANRERYS